MSTSISSTCRSTPLAIVPDNVQSLVETARSLHDEAFSDPSHPPCPSEHNHHHHPLTPTQTTPDAICTVAPGRVNLIGEHTDYNDGLVLPMAIGYGTVCYGIGRVERTDEPDGGRCRVISANQQDNGGTGTGGGGHGGVVKFRAVRNTKPLKEPQHQRWSNYVLGVLDQFMPDLPANATVSFDLAIAGNVPLGSGLSSSASLEVAVATFLECLFAQHANWPVVVYSSSTRVAECSAGSGDGGDDGSASAAKKTRAMHIERALRCQKAENVFCASPCGIMDQFVSSCASAGVALLIDCRSCDYEEATLGTGPDVPAIVVANSNVTHSIGGGEYPKRVQQCRDATDALKDHQRTGEKYLGSEIKMLRDVSSGQVEAARDSMDDIAYRRARHVTTENRRTVQAKDALDRGDWEEMGRLMNASHESMRDDYEVSCEEIDTLVDLAQAFDGVYGSRLTGGGFGGCTVTLVRKDRVGPLMEHLKKGYLERMGRECDCFETSPSDGAREIVL